MLLERVLLAVLVACLTAAYLLYRQARPRVTRPMGNHGPAPVGTVGQGRSARAAADEPLPDKRAACCSSDPPTAGSAALSPAAPSAESTPPAVPATPVAIPNVQETRVDKTIEAQDSATEQGEVAPQATAGRRSGVPWGGRCD